MVVVGSKHMILHLKDTINQKMHRRLEEGTCMTALMLHHQGVELDMTAQMHHHQDEQDMIAQMHHHPADDSNN